MQTIYLEEAAQGYPLTLATLQRYPSIQTTLVKSHWQIPELNLDPDQAGQWLKNKQNVLVLGVKKGLTIRENGRSADFIAVSHANGCLGSCSYCYVGRRKGSANPITLFVNTDQIVDAVRKHAEKLGPKTTPNQCDPTYWVYDIGENSDVSVDAQHSPVLKQYVELFKKLPNAKGSFATKFVNDELLSYDPQGKMRIRFSVMPERFSKILDVGTTPVRDRIRALNRFVEAGWEVHLNFSPVIVGEGWREAYTELLDQIRAEVSEATLAQLKCEVIFLTHSPELHEVNLQWHPKGEELIWMPDIQEPKADGTRLRYRWQWKNQWRDWLNGEITYRLGIPIRYSF